MLRASRSLLLLLTLVFTLSPFYPHFAHGAGSDSDQLATDIDKALRSAEKNIFSGNSQEGAAILNEIAVKLEELKTADPNNEKLITIISKFSQLQKNVGQNTSPHPKPESGSATIASPKQELSAVEQATSGFAAIAMTGITGHLDRAEKTLQSGTGDLGKASLTRAADKYEALAKKYPKLINQPEIVATKQRLDALLIQAEQAGSQQKTSQ